MSVQWEQWQHDLLERERIFERPRIVRANRKAPMGFWELLILLVAGMLIGAGIVAIGRAL